MTFNEKIRLKTLFYLLMRDFLSTKEMEGLVGLVDDLSKKKRPLLDDDSLYDLSVKLVENFCER